MLPEGTSALPVRVRLWLYQRGIAAAISDPEIAHVGWCPSSRLSILAANCSWATLSNWMDIIQLAAGVLPRPTGMNGCRATDLCQQAWRFLTGTTTSMARWGKNRKITFPVNAASDMLERTRRTVKRALRHVPPDSYERGQPRWRLPKIIEALEFSGAPLTEQRHIGDVGQLADRCEVAFAEFDRRFGEMTTTPALAKRRKMSIALASLIAETIRLMKARDTADGLHPDHVDLKGDRVFALLMVGFCEPCQWSREQAWRHLDATGDDDTDAG